MNWKRIVAKEWLYILSFAAGSLLLGYSIFFLFEPDLVQDPGPERKATLRELYGDMKPTFTELLEEKKRSIYDDLSISKEEAIAELNRRGIEVSVSRVDSIKNSIHTQWLDDKRKYDKYRVSRKTVEEVSKAVMVLPYPLILFIRTIIWSIRQVRKKPHETK